MTRRVLALITALCLVFGMIPAVFAAETGSGTLDNGMTWVLDESGTLTVSGTGAMADYSHTSTSDIPWYTHASEITAVVVEEGVTTIGEAAFYQCSNLAELTLPSTLTSIGRNAFSYCAISELDLPDGLLTLGNFNGNPITELVIPDSVTTILDNAFNECIQLTSVVLPASLETCGSRAFGNCILLSQAVMPEMPNIQYFNGNVFSGCAFTDLDWFTHSEIGYQMFSSNDFIELEIPDCVTTLGNFALENCKSMTKVTVPASVTSLGAVTFGSCTALEEVYFLGDAPDLGADLVQRLTDVTFYYPAGNETWTADVRNTYDGVVTWVAYDYDSGEISPDQPEDPTEPQPDYIHSGVYNGNINWSYNENSGLLRLSGAGEMPTPEDIFYPWDDYKYDYSQVDIGEDMTHIGARCFASSTNLHEITIPGNIQHIGGSAFSHSNIRDAYIEDGVQTIGTSAFYNSYVETVQLPSSLAQTTMETTFEGCANLTSVAVPEGIEILFETFDGCTSLTTVTLPSTLRNISLSAFEGCQALTSIELPEGLETIEDYAFADTASLTELTIPSTVTFIGAEAFGSVGWYDGEEHHNGISTIYFTGDAPTFSDYSFAGYPEEHELTCYYPADNDTWTDEVLQQYGGNVIWVAEGEESDPTEPSDPSEPSEPDDDIIASGTCGSNASWVLDQDGVLTLSGVGDVYPEEVDTAPWYGYRDQILHLVVEDGITLIWGGAFFNCYNMKTAVIADSVTELGAWTFERCSSLTDVKLSENLAYIGPDIFIGCSSLESIVIPDSAVSIENSAFEGCTALREVLIPDSVTQIAEDAFENCPNLTIYCYNLSFAHMYAEAYGIPYQVLEDEPNTPVYNIHVTCNAGGTSAVTPNPSPANRYVLLEMQPDKGYALDAVYYECVSNPGLELVYEQIGETAIMFFMPEGDLELQVYFMATESPFKDVKSSDYFYQPVLWAVSYGVTTGMGNGRFAPNDSCTRAQVVTFLWRAAGEPEPISTKNPFKDVKSSDYFYKAVLWAVENGITTGMSATSFGPSRPCTRGQVVTFLYRAAGGTGSYQGINPFKDVKSSDYYYDAVLWAVDYGITTGMSKTSFAPNNTCTRGQVVTFLYRFMHG